MPSSRFPVCSRRVQRDSYPMAVASPPWRRYTGLGKWGLSWCRAPGGVGIRCLTAGVRRCRWTLSKPQAASKDWRLAMVPPGNRCSLNGSRLPHWRWRALLRLSADPPGDSIVAPAWTNQRARASCARRCRPARQMANKNVLSAKARLLVAGSRNTPTSHRNRPAARCSVGCSVAWHKPSVSPSRKVEPLTDALVARLTAHGGIVECNQRRGDVVRNRRAVAVRTAGGELVSAGRAVIADVPAPALYSELIARRRLPAPPPPGVLSDLERFQWDDATVKVDWALDRPVPFLAERAAPASFTSPTISTISPKSTPHLWRCVSCLAAHSSSLGNNRSPTRRAERDGNGMSTHVPRVIKGDGAKRLQTANTEEWLDGFIERLEERVEAPRRAFARQSSSPCDVATRPGEENESLVGGAIGGGTSQLHQQLWLRPLPGMGRSETPIIGLFLASSSAHPGGGVHGAPGANAARAALARMAATRSVLFGPRVASPSIAAFVARLSR